MTLVIDANRAFKRSPVCVLSAVSREIKPLISRFNLVEEKIIKPWIIYSGTINQLPDFATHSGCGKVLASAATQMLLGQFHPCALLHFGTAGAISPMRKQGDVIIETCSIEIDYHERMIPGLPQPKSCPDLDLVKLAVKTFEDNSLPFVQGAIACQDGDVVSREEKQEIWERYGAECVCWEGSAVGRICNAAGVPYLQIRGITDLADCSNSAAFDFNSRISGVSEKLSDYIDKILCRMQSSF